MSESGVLFLVAEKDMGLRASLVEMVRNMGLGQVLAAVSGAQAWSAFNADAPHLVLSGWNLGDISGLSLLKLVRAHRQLTQTPFVLVSEILTQAQAVEAAAAGVSDLMRRPLNPQRLRERIEAILAQAYDAQELQLRRLYREGLALMGRKEWAKAGQIFAALVGAVETPEALYHLGCVQDRLGRPQEAALSLARAVRLEPLFLRASLKLGQTLLTLGRDREAEPHLERAVEIFLDQAADPDSALGVFQEHLKPGSDYFAVFDALGIIYRRSGRYAQAHALYAKALTMNPGDGNIHHHIGRTYYETGAYGEAAKSLRRALELTSGLTEAAKLLKIVEAKLKTTG